MAQFTNQASISYNGLTANSNIVTGEITRVLSVSKTSVSGSYRRGDTLAQTEPQVKQLTKPAATPQGQEQRRARPCVFLILAGYPPGCSAASPAAPSAPAYRRRGPSR